MREPEKRRPPVDQTEEAATNFKQASEAVTSVPPERCPALKADGAACRAWPAEDGWPYCSSHRWLNRHLVGTDGSWTAAYAGAESWIREVGRERWPEFAANDAIWACSIASWATYGRRTA